MNYNYLFGQECKSECNDYYKLEDIDTTLNLIQCFKTKEDCFSFQNSLSLHPNYYNTKLKKCWINFPDGYFINQIDTVNNKLELVPECEKYYFPDSNYNNHYRCVPSCSASSSSYLYYYKGEKNCEDSCKNFNKFYKDPNNNECLDTCIGRKIGVNYIEFSDEIDLSLTDPVVDCKLSCGTNQHYNYGTKVCINGVNCAQGKFIRYNEVPIVCYDSCNEIPEVNTLYEK